MIENTFEAEAVALTPEAWDMVREDLKLSGIAAQLAKKARNVYFVEGGLVLMNIDYADRALAEDAHVAKLGEALGDLFGQDLYVGVEILQSH